MTGQSFWTYRQNFENRGSGACGRKRGRSFYYAVAKGRKPGIYRTWDACKSQINGFRNSFYKRFNKLNDAQNFVRDNKEEGTAKHYIGGISATRNINDEAEDNGRPINSAHKTTVPAADGGIDEIAMEEGQAQQVAANDSTAAVVAATD